MYIITTTDGEILHDPNLYADGRVLIDPVLKEQLNTHGSLTFTIAPTHPMYHYIRQRDTQVRVICDVDNGAPDWFGRVIDIQKSLNNCKIVYCEGELAFLLDAISQPFGFKGSPATLFANLLSTYRSAGTRGPMLFPGNVSVTDPNDLIVRSSQYADTVWARMSDKLFNSSLGGYIIARYDRAQDKHFVDYLTLDPNDPYAHVSSQVVEFGENLLDFVQDVSAENVVTAVIPYGAEFVEDDSRFEDAPPENGVWNGNRLTVEDVNNGSKIVTSQTGVQLFGVVQATKIWDNVTLAKNLLTKAQAWVDAQAMSALTLEVSAVDLAFARADIEQIRLGDLVRVVSVPHDIDAILVCTQKETHLTSVENSRLTIGKPAVTISDVGMFASTDDESSAYASRSLQRTKIIVKSIDETDTLGGYGVQSGFVTEAGKLFVIRSNSRYTVFDLSITSGTKIIAGSIGTGVPLGHDIGHGNSACYSNGLAYVSHWYADDGGDPATQTADGGIIHVFSVDNVNNTMTYVRDIVLPTVVGRRTEHYVYPGEREILSLGWEYRSSANSKYMILTMWKKGSDGVYVKSWERSVMGVNVAQGMAVCDDKLYIVSDRYDSVAGYSHEGLMIVDIGTGLQKYDVSQTGRIQEVETEQIIPLGGGQYLIVGNRGGLFHCIESA